MLYDKDHLKGLPLDEAARTGGTTLARALRVALIHDGAMPLGSPLPDLEGAAPRRPTIKNLEFSHAARRAASLVKEGADDVIGLARTMLADVYSQRIAMDLMFGDFLGGSNGNPPEDYSALRSAKTPPAVALADGAGDGNRDLDAISEGRFHDVKANHIRAALADDLNGALTDVRNEALDRQLRDIDASLPKRNLLEQAGALRLASPETTQVADQPLPDRIAAGIAQWGRQTGAFTTEPDPAVLREAVRSGLQGIADPADLGRADLERVHLTVRDAIRPHLGDNVSQRAMNDAVLRSVGRGGDAGAAPILAKGPAVEVMPLVPAAQRER